MPVLDGELRVEPVAHDTKAGTEHDASALGCVEGRDLARRIGVDPNPNRMQRTDCIDGFGCIDVDGDRRRRQRSQYRDIYFADPAVVEDDYWRMRRR